MAGLNASSSGSSSENEEQFMSMSQDDLKTRTQELMDRVMVHDEKSLNIIIQIDKVDSIRVFKKARARQQLQQSRASTSTVGQHVEQIQEQLEPQSQVVPSAQPPQAPQ